MFWADELAEKLISERGKKQTVATGISPSGPIHVGNLRETTVGDTVAKALKKQGADVRFIWIADDFDRLRKVYPFLPATYEKYIGMPLSGIPDPKGNCHKSYAEHFMADFVETMPKLGIKPEVLSATELYKKGVYTKKITQALEKRLEIKKILEDISRRELNDDYSPYNPYCGGCGKDYTKVIEYDLAKTRVKYHCSECNKTGWSDYSKGEGKLSWRVDWPARWSIFGITAEPGGKELATVGGSFDTGAKICQDIFGFQPPERVFYEFLYLKGSQGKMSSSLGNVMTPSEMILFIPPQILRYLLIKNKNRHLVLDPGVGIIQLANEYTKLEQEVANNQAGKDEITLYSYTQIGKNRAKSSIPFNHLATVYQSAQGNMDEALRQLKQTNHLDDVGLVKQDLKRVRIWLKKYAPEEIKFTVQSKLPAAARELSVQQKKLLAEISEYISQHDDPEKLHNYIYETGKEIGLNPKQTFEAIYLVFLGKTSGPKVGWFLSSLDKQFVIKRLKEISYA